ncbi:hypothetical protein M2163_000856 [Streptomyces sp. SAI-135]|nr:hypothetical protein [Streptomyces sp. SAI-090]MDH6554257.1 hypothetical protein [Streptomyces sp. SAI-041]MDH6573517.1 hypothetical protein [Streptomyces sp. SAI-117]MDH6581745.1 hypothetical protein [Streptomyces sp. SAI-133]MDH6613748.1 hypothetical protein [Streptomyces sp. SAI-135]
MPASTPTPGRAPPSAEELEAVVTPLMAAGVDAFHTSTRRYWLPEVTAPN